MISIFLRSCARRFTAAAGALLLSSTFSATALEAALAHPKVPLLWKVEGKELTAPSYLFGTIHLGEPPIDTLHPAAQRAFDASEALYTEIEMSPAVQLAMTEVLPRKDGKTLAESIGPELSAQLEAELQRINPALTAAVFQPLKTWAVAMAMPLLPYQLRGGKAQDTLLWERAEAAGKKTLALEKPQDQLGIFDSLTEPEQVIVLKETLRQLAEDRAANRDSMAELVAAYVEGDAKALETLIARSLEGLEEGEHKELGKRLNRKLLHDRNITMAAAIKSAVEAEPGRTNFFAVGSGHYLGEENIRDILTEDGYTVTHVAE